MSREVTGPPDVSEWQAQYLRLIAFPVESQVSTCSNWWQQVTGDEPESTTQKGRISFHATGPYRGNALSLDVDVRRVQWTLVPAPDPSQFGDDPPTLGDFKQQAGGFRQVMERWFALSPGLNRLAFASLLLLSGGGARSDVYEQLERCLRHVNVNPQFSDFQFRANRPIASRTGVQDLVVNRLCTWSEVTVKIDVLPERGQADRFVLLATRHFCALELDINTAVPRDQLPNSRLMDIFSELMDFGKLVAESGDDALWS